MLLGYFTRQKPWRRQHVLWDDRQTLGRQNPSFRQPMMILLGTRRGWATDILKHEAIILEFGRERLLHQTAYAEMGRPQLGQRQLSL